MIFNEPMLYGPVVSYKRIGTCITVCDCEPSMMEEEDGIETLG